LGHRGPRPPRTGLLIDEPHDSEFNAAIRGNGEQTAAVGAAALADEVDSAVADQRARR
jgi:hypothetical protein